MTVDISTLQYFYIGLAAFLVGFTKTSVGGVGILAVLLMAMAIPGKASPGVLLPMLIAADIICRYLLQAGLPVAYTYWPATINNHRYSAGVLRSSDCYRSEL